MGTIDEAVFTPHWPEPEELRKQLQPYVSYHDVSDTLMIYFYGQPSAAVSVPTDHDDFTYLRVDPETHAVVGIQIEHFLKGFVPERPEMLAFAILAGLSEDDIRHARAEIDPDLQRRAAVDLMMSSLGDSLSLDT